MHLGELVNITLVAPFKSERREKSLRGEISLSIIVPTAYAELAGISEPALESTMSHISFILKNKNSQKYPILIKSRSITLFHDC